MKAITLLLALAGGTGFFFRDQLQSLVHSPGLGMGHFSARRQAPEGVYYLRTSFMFPVADGAARWSPGQELRMVPDEVADRGFVTLTDGENTAEVPLAAVTREMDDVAALGQFGASIQKTGRQTAGRETNLPLAATRQADAPPQTRSTRLVSGQFHSTSLDAPAVRTALPENIVSTAGAPVVYGPVYGPVVVPAAQQRSGSSSGAINVTPRR